MEANVMGLERENGKENGYPYKGLCRVWGFRV